MARIAMRSTQPRSCGAGGTIGASVLLGIFLLAIASPAVSAATPTLSILSPANGQILGNGTPVIVSFAVSNFGLVQPGRVGQAVGPTEGHVDLYVDGAYAQILTRVEPIVLPLGSGPHTIRIRLVQSDGTPLSPDVNASVRVVMTQGPAEGTPTITIVSPRPGPTIAHDVYVAIEVTNFALVDPHGQPNAPNEGHVQLFLNGVFNQEPRAYDLGFIVDIPDGSNTVTARLVNNDNTPLSPNVSATVTIYVQGAPDPIGSERTNLAVLLLLGLILLVMLVRRRKAVARFSDGRRREPPP